MDLSDLQPLIEQHYPRVRRAALAMCGDRWEADEIAQETFIVAMQSIERFREEAAVETWLYGICIRVQRNRFRAAARYARRLTRWARDRCTDANRSDLADDIDEPETLWTLVRRLPQKQREVLVLRFAEELTVPEIARTLDCREGTVKSRLHHGLRKLRERLSEQADGSGEGFDTCERTSNDRSPEPGRPLHPLLAIRGEGRS